jgi:urocanate hydratase
MPHTIRAPRGVQLTCKNWPIEAAYHMLQNNLGDETVSQRLCSSSGNVL